MTPAEKIEQRIRALKAGARLCDLGRAESQALVLESDGERRVRDRPLGLVPVRLDVKLVKEGLAIFKETLFWSTGIKGALLINREIRTRLTDKGKIAALKILAEIVAAESAPVTTYRPPRKR